LTKRDAGIFARGRQKIVEYPILQLPEYRIAIPKPIQPLRQRSRRKCGELLHHSLQRSFGFRRFGLLKKHEVAPNAQCDHRAGTELIALQSIQRVEAKQRTLQEFPDLLYLIKVWSEACAGFEQQLCFPIRSILEHHDGVIDEVPRYGLSHLLRVRGNRGNSIKCRGS
jgi:hypothetical protein